MTLELPWPTSVNRYWRNVRGRTLISADGRAYRRAVKQRALVGRWESLGDARLRVSITAHPPDKRRRDLDNMMKALLDALEAAGVYANDSQIDDLRIVRGKAVKRGRMIVTLEEL